MPITCKVLNFLKKGIPAFVETGTLNGEAVDNALKCNFEKIFSIESDKFRYDKCCDRFKNNSNVFLTLGDSSKDLTPILKKLSCRILFWLDAHYSRGEKISERGFETQPLIAELRQIGQHSIKNHTILIDDRRLFTGEHPNWHNLREEEVIAELKKINPDYNISFVDSSLFNSDIIVAEIL